MGRLIDAEAFERAVMFGDAEDMQDVIYALRDYPTAYDPEKVVEQLENLKTINVDIGFGTTVSTLRKDVVIEIVKAGGTDAEH